MEKQIKAFLITFRRTNNELKTSYRIRNFSVLAKTKIEAQAIFEKHLQQNIGIYDYEIIAIQTLRKTAKNAHLITKEKYEEQLYSIDTYAEALEKHRKEQ